MSWALATSPRIKTSNILLDLRVPELFSRHINVCKGKICMRPINKRGVEGLRKKFVIGLAPNPTIYIFGNVFVTKSRLNLGGKRDSATRTKIS